MNKFHVVLASSFTLASAASAVNPQMGGMMKHLGVEMHGGSMLHIHVDHSVPTPLLQNYGHAYDAPADVLNDTMYNAQYGWMIEGFWTLPPNATIWIEQLDATPGLQVYIGGTMMNQGTFAPIFGTAGSSPRIAWNGTMLHNWYAVTTPGVYEATYRVYLGDANGLPLPGYFADEVTIEWFAQGPCQADLNSDGILDFFDVQAFLGAFSAGDLSVDFVDDGVLDFFDVQAFLAAFSAGCP
ncbi:MAG: hypothetical protein KF757_05355 [Phycisphaeraceae bacterium]|nr:hypothetical protein [Phycisphaeraceae bacterium]MCW5763804.1 hypothetical protein [Phycisphaeraceae bacterium]